MKPAAETTFAERAGRVFGRMWRAGARLDRKARGWLVARGLGVGVATGLLWAVKLVVLGVLLYAAFWLALLLVFMAAVAWAAGQSHAQDESEWPFMSEEEVRRSPGYDPNVYNDASHEMFEDD